MINPFTDEYFMKSFAEAEMALIKAKFLLGLLLSSMIE
jgi:hypothetical protein